VSTISQFEALSMASWHIATLEEDS
jgi:hypothetical protein